MNAYIYTQRYLKSAPATWLVYALRVAHGLFVFYNNDLHISEIFIIFNFDFILSIIILHIFNKTLAPIKIFKCLQSKTPYKLNSAIVFIAITTKVTLEFHVYRQADIILRHVLY